MHIQFLLPTLFIDLKGKYMVGDRIVYLMYQAIYCIYEQTNKSHRTVSIADHGARLPVQSEFIHAPLAAPHLHDVISYRVHARVATQATHQI